jgi:beta-N-acetylhexosaminidase
MSEMGKDKVILVLILLVAIVVALLFGIWTVINLAKPVAGETAVIPTSILPANTPIIQSQNPPTPEVTPKVTETTASIPPTQPAPVSDNTPLPAPTKTIVTAEEIEALLSTMTLDQKIGQMLMIGLPGPQLDLATQDYIQQLGIGGIIFLDRNIQNPEQLRTLTESLQAAALNSQPAIPVFIAWNYEGGDIIRENTAMTAFPSNMAVGSVNSPESTYKMGRAVGQEMRDLGINMNYAPVLDINTDSNNPIIGLRSYGDSAELVANLGNEYIKGLQDANVIAVAKHFPGHGDDNVDSHYSLPTILASADTLKSRELKPFAAAIENDVGGIMMGHLYVPELMEPGAPVQPSSISNSIVSGLLRQEMNYNQVIMTDDMGMGAITNSYNPGIAATEAVKAGNDLILTVDFMQYPQQFHTAIKNGVLSGEIPETQIDASVRRILRLKLENNLADYITIENDYPDHREFAYHLGIQAVKAANNGAQIELGEDLQSVLLVSPSSTHPGTTTGDDKGLLNELLTNCGYQVTEYFYNPETPSDVQQIQTQAVQAVPGVDLALVMTWDAALKQNNLGDTSQTNMVNAIANTNIPTIMIAGHNPHDVDLFPDIPLRIMTFGVTYGQIVGILDHLPLTCADANTAALPAPN